MTGQYVLEFLQKLPPEDLELAFIRNHFQFGDETENDIFEEVESIYVNKEKAHEYKPHGIIVS